ncbi:FliI/YscN family ATPase [Roseovarius dicentrarchi]|uniref:FliI/YscN family ATPase n=1 Tax=Roseovarius dicentrarchi TaxID=2250573 RepID=UPI000DEA49EC|nr:FliI/YscN family ATPase [Roseovarius dicentrarchi]
MATNDLECLGAEIAGLHAVHAIGRVSAVTGATLEITGLSGAARLGDRLCIRRRDGSELSGEVLGLAPQHIVMLPDGAPTGVALGDRVSLHDAATIAPSNGWIGRIIDPYGKAMDGRPIMRGAHPRALRADPPPPAQRNMLGARLETGSAVFNTFLPIVRGQRIGLFAGSGVGKSSLLASLARNVQADVVVFAMIGERGRELRDFAENVLGPEGMARSIIVAATSDQSPLVRRRCAWTAMAVAEHFRDQGLEVLLLADSITRFAEAHREVATAAGEMPSLRGFPASTSHMIMSLCERAGPGGTDQGNITGIFSVLVAGSDMDEPVADILRGVLDGHVVMDREIAERGRYPAINLLRSVSRSLPRAATDSENDLLGQARALLGAYDRSETMIRAGLYAQGSDPQLDQAIRIWPELDRFMAESEAGTAQDSFDRLALILRRAASAPSQGRKPQAASGARPVKDPMRPPVRGGSQNRGNGAIAPQRIH